MVRMLEIDPLCPQAEPLGQARAALAAGGLVIVPTETVYGLACDPAAPGALARLAAAKGRDAGKPVARLAAGAKQVRADAKRWSPGLEALAAKYWPGPLTIVLETATGWTGYRVPAHAVALELARVCGRPLALTSANPGGGPDTRTAQEAADAVEADLALDAGPSADLAVPSTVVKVDGGTIACLREGCLPFAEVERAFAAASAPARRVLFVCAGNTCRSPMAEALFRHRIGAGTGWDAASAGLCAVRGAPASPGAVEVMRELGFDLAGHRSQPLDAGLVAAADLVVAMTAAQRLQILDGHPGAAGKVSLITSFGTSKAAADVFDPFGGSIHVYRLVRDEIDRALSDLVLFLRTGEK